MLRCAGAFMANQPPPNAVVFVRDQRPVDGHEAAGDQLSSTTPTPTVLRPESAFVAALHRVQLGVIITVTGARPSFLNAYAQMVLEQRDGLTVTNTGLEAETRADTRAL